MGEISVKRRLQQLSDPYDECERLELIAYERLAHRSAILHKLRSTLGPDLELKTDPLFGAEILDMHNALLRQTRQCVELLRDLDAAKRKSKDLNEREFGRKSSAL
jgi:hypothetical protein